eukprot:TRINITY_DN27171_c0_g1_i1.p1 TRINITY_DN27171_c0_g1~~TRINITY_DN27171_c0_g1_i1.p1  ORF type:complete len:101 (-),score=5.22 TRINITY_DN27171_c0_g1_i1:16-318(-)
MIAFQQPQQSHDINNKIIPTFLHLFMYQESIYIPEFYSIVQLPNTDFSNNYDRKQFETKLGSCFEQNNLQFCGIIQDFAQKNILLVFAKYSVKRTTTVLN